MAEVFRGTIDFDNVITINDIVHNVLQIVNHKCD